MSIDVQYNKRDIEVIQFISIFGKSFAEVLGQTYYGSIQSARNGISKMKRIGLVKFVPTGLAKPRNSIVLTASAKHLLTDMGYSPKESRVSIGQMEHNMVEQIAYYYLGKVGTIKRASVYNDKNKYYAVPDLVLSLSSGNIFIEVEMHQKSKAAYRDFVTRVVKDNPRAVLYVCSNKRIMKSIANAMMQWDRLIYIDIDTLIENVSIYGKVGGTKQSELMHSSN